MKFTLSWLKLFLNTDAGIEEIAMTLTMIGLEVEEIFDLEIEGGCSKHFYATMQSSIYGLDQLKSSVLSKSSSNEISDRNRTINKNNKKKAIRMPKHSTSGSTSQINIEDANSLTHDYIISINVTPNRADTLSVYGIARDLAAAGIGILRKMKIPQINSNFFSDIKVQILNEEACSLFAIYELKNIKNIESPEWLKFSLECIGIKSNSAVVDIINYVTHAFGQPMHAYDADKIKEDIIVDILDSSQKFLALNDKEYHLNSNDIVIKSEHEIYSLAGIIGSKNTNFNQDTNRIIVEAGCFNRKYIIRSGRKLMIETDSRYRFERYINKEFTLKALNYAIHLILMTCGGEASFPKISGCNKFPVRSIDFSLDFFVSKSGFNLNEEKIILILEKLGFACKKKKKTIKIKIPPWRQDISIEDDIVEEIIRIYGYDKLPITPLPNINVKKIITPEQRRSMHVRRILATSGYTEIVSWSFMDSKKAKVFYPINKELMIENPISAELDYMRPSIVPNLLKVASNNINRSYKDLSLFELGPIFNNTENITPTISIGAIRLGADLPRNCHTVPQNVNIFDLKSDLETVLNYLGFELDKCQIISKVPEYYHPACSSSIAISNNIVAYLGQIHPSVLKIFGIEINVLAFEIELSSLPVIKSSFARKMEPKISDYQMVNRDFAFIIDETQPVGEVLSFIKNIDKKLIKNVFLYDIYNGKKIEKDKKSITISVRIQNDNQTLTEKDINNINDIIINKTKNRFRASLRDR